MHCEEIHDGSCNLSVAMYTGKYYPKQLVSPKDNPRLTATILNCFRRYLKISLHENEITSIVFYCLPTFHEIMRLLLLSVAIFIVQKY